METDITYTPEEKANFFKISVTAGAIFNPNTPISEKDLFSGRTTQIRRVLDVILQKGQHAIIFGERGVGKTSLANVLSGFFPEAQSILVTRINCDRSDTFITVWRKVFDGMKLSGTQKTMGFHPTTQQLPFTAENFLQSEDNVPEQVRKALADISNTFLPVIIIDEFDRLEEDVRKLFADFIKGLSDYSIAATIILIGVGDSVAQLINEHQSVARALAEIQMPRMTPIEIEEIITNCLTRLNMTISPDTLVQIKLLAKGLPHYAHLIGLHASRDALDKFSMNISDENLGCAIKKAIEDSQHSITTNYHNAIRSTHKDNLFADVLLACALSETNELGEFAAQDLREPIKRITGKDYNIPAYAQHLKEFTDSKRGNILIKSGVRKRFRYKFSDPLLQPYIIMQGLKNQKINPHYIKEVSN